MLRLNLASDVMSVYCSFRPTLIQKGLHALELCGYNSDLEVYLGCYDSTQLTIWLEAISKGKKFAEWYQKVTALISNQSSLTPSTLVKL